MASAHSSPYTQPPQGGSQPYALPPPQQGQEVQPGSQYPQYSYDIQLRYPQDPNRPYPPPPQVQGLQLPPMATMDMQTGYGQQEMAGDTTGQVAPPGMKPRVTATLWEDEGTLCFQVDVKGTCVARREGKHTYGTSLDFTMLI
jgi:enhanced filamentous growth protein 1